MSADSSQNKNAVDPENIDQQARVSAESSEENVSNEETVSSDQTDQAATKQPKRGCLRIIMMTFAFLIVAVVIAIVYTNSTGQTDEEKKQVELVEEAVKKLEQSQVKPISTELSEKPIVKNNRAEQFPNSVCNVFDENPPESTEHPLDTPLLVARRGLRYIRKNINDYTATLVKQERVNDKLLPQEIMHVKIRTQKLVEKEIALPLHVYLKFLSPKSMAGREVIWVRGRNGNKFVVHEAGILGLIRVNLLPNDRMFAMKNNRYPISEIGIETLVLRMLQKGLRDSKRDECVVKIDRTVSIDDRPCTQIRIEHPIKRDYFDFHIAEITIDDKYNVPVRYAAYIWPEEEGGEPLLIEKYTYLDMVINPGLPDSAFDPDNPEYNFP